MATARPAPSATPGARGSSPGWTAAGPAAGQDSGSPERQDAEPTGQQDAEPAHREDAGAAGRQEGWRILALQPLSGPLQPLGEPIARGLALWAEEVNAAGGASGRQVQLEVLDTGGDSERAARLAWEWAGQADLVVAPYGSEATQAVMEACERLGVALLAPAAGDEELWGTQRRRSVQLLPGNRRVWWGALAWASATGFSRVALAYRDDPFTRSAAEGVRRATAEWGLGLAGEVAVDAEATSLELQAACRALLNRLASGPESPRARPTPAERLVVLGGGYRPGAPLLGFGPDAAAIVRATRALEPDAAVIALVAPAHPEFARLVDPGELKGCGGVTLWQPWFADDDSRKFTARYRRAYGEDPDSHAASGYVAGQVFEAAVRLAGAGARMASRRAAAGAAPGPAPDVLAAALRGLQTRTLLGEYRVDGQGRQVGLAYRVTLWQGGRLSVAWPPPTA